MKNIRNSFLTSIVALLLCLMMFIGTTFAWFTDEVTSSANKIIAGNLKLDLEVLDKATGAWYSVKENSDPIFNYENWEPGYTNATFLKVENEGNLALKWQARFSSSNGVSKLAEVIDVYVLPSETELSYNNLTRDLDGWQKVGTLDQFINTLSDTTYGYLEEAGEVAYLGIALHMQEDAGNEYQGIGLEAFDIQIVATQMSHEDDSFGPDYDKDAVWPEGEMSFEATQSVANIPTLYGELTEEVIIRYNDAVYAILPAGVKLADGVTELKFSGKSVENGENITLGEGDSAKSYDIHIEGIHADNQKPITVHLGAIAEKNLNETSLKLFHEDVQMTRVNSIADFAISNQFTYNPDNGTVVIYVNHFSVFSAVETTADKWDGTYDIGWYNTTSTSFTLDTAAEFAGFRAIVDGGYYTVADGVWTWNEVTQDSFEGKTVKLGADIDLDKNPFDPIGFGYYDNSKVDEEGTDHNTVFMGTFDGAGHTIYNLYQNCWELDPDKENYSTYTYSTAGAGLFASIKDATIMNLAVSGAEIVFECVDMGVVVGYAQGECHFENIIVTDSNIANYNRYTGGLVGEVSYGVDNNEDGYSHTFKNITIDSSVTVSGLWGSFGCGMGGVIGGKWGDATVLMENVVSAPVMDVYNDVVSAYQWYAFRGCGMLIGHTEEPYSDGRHSGNATASFLTCENVTVYYGDWVNYHYYEFENQDSTTGQRYPWVRAEAGEYCDAFSNIRYGVPTHNGVKVSDLTEEELKAKATDYTPIVFDQLYGADRGMYGTATHEGVNVYYKNTKTIYIENNLSWTNLKLNYWFAHGNETWTTLTDAIALTEENGVYKVDLPAYVHTFKISSTESAEGKSFELSGLTDGEHINLDGEHIHAFVNQECVCGAVRFEFGANENVTHSDGSEAKEYSETVNEYTLTLEELSKVYKSANDAFGNSCLKLGTGNYTGSFAFTVPENVTQVILYIAKYKDDTSTVEINDVSYELTKNSTDGEYDEIVVDTKETKTITVATTSSAKRCMVNSIVFIVEKFDHEHNYTSVVTDPTCTEDGYTTYTCSVCEHSYIDNKVSKTYHSYDEGAITVAPTCTENGVLTKTCKTCGDTKTEEITATGHNFVDGKCECGESEPSSIDYSYTFDAKQFSENGTVTLNDVNWTAAGDGSYWGYDGTKGQQFGSGNNPYKTLTLTSDSFNNISKIVINTSGASSTAAKLNVYVGDTLVDEITLTSSATDYTIDISDLSGAVKFYFTQTSSKAIYIKSIKVTYAASGGETSNPETPTEPTKVLEITADDFNSTSYAANNNTKTEGDYSYTSYQVMNQSNTMQWQKSKGYITIASNDFVKLEMTSTAGSYSVTVGGKTVTGTTSNGVTTYDLTGLSGEVKISVGSATGYVEYLKFYK